MRRVIISYGIVVALSLVTIEKTKAQVESQPNYKEYVDHGDLSNLDTDIEAGSFGEYIDKAKRGDSESMRLVALCYMTGTGVEKDFNEAWKWFGKASKAGNFRAEYNIGTLFHDGYGVAQDYEESAYWFRKAARNGDRDAMAAIARQFENGEGVQKDLRIAAEYYWRAAEKGDAKSTYRYAEMLRDGEGVKQDLAKSKIWFEKARKFGMEVPETSNYGSKTKSALKKTDKKSLRW